MNKAKMKCTYNDIYIYINFRNRTFEWAIIFLSQMSWNFTHTALTVTLWCVTLIVDSCKAKDLFSSQHMYRFNHSYIS